MEEFLITLMVILAITNCCLCICITWLIEKLGGVLGGILACIPSTLVVVVWGQYAHHVASLSWSLSSFSSLGFLQYQKTLMSIPLGMGVNSLYLFLWKVVPNFYARWFPRLPLYGLLTVVFLTNISAWFTCTVTLQYLLEHLHASSSSSSSSLGSTTMDSVHEKESPSQGSSFHPSLQWIYILGLSATVMAWVIGAGVCWAPLRAPKGHARTPWYIYLIRGLGTGCTTALGIYVSTTHAYLGGLITVFPVIFTTTVVSVWIYQGKAVSQGAIGPLMLGQTSTGCLVCMMTFLPRSLPFYGALLVSWVVCVVGVNAPVYVYVQWRMKVTQRKRERKTMVRESRGGEVENDVEERRV